MSLEIHRAVLRRLVPGALAIGAAVSMTSCGLPLLPPSMRDDAGSTSVEPREAPAAEAPAAEPEPPVPPGAEETDVFDLAVGDCYNDASADGDEVGEVVVVDCSEPHDYEVYWSHALEDGGYPGLDAIQGEAEEVCRERFASFVGLPYGDSEIYLTYLYPTERTWLFGDREILCMVYEQGVMATGTLAGAGR